MNESINCDMSVMLHSIYIYVYAYIQQKFSFENEIWVGE